MNYIKRLPISTLKIDRSFVRGVTTNASDAGITTAILAMARSLGLDVIAEGVGTVEQRAFLGSARCPRLPGYLFGPPLAPELMLGMLRTGSAVARREAVGA